MTYIDGSNHLENINKQSEDSDRQSTSSDSDSRESECEEETYTVHCGGYIAGNSQLVCDSYGYVFHAQQSKFYDSLKCDNFALCRLCNKKGMHM